MIGSHRRGGWSDVYTAFAPSALRTCFTHVHSAFQVHILFNLEHLWQTLWDYPASKISQKYPKDNPEILRRRKLPWSTSKYQYIPQSTQKYLKVTQCTQKKLKAPKITTKYSKVPQRSQKYLKVPWNTQKYLKETQSTQKYPKLPQSNEKYLKIP